MTQKQAASDIELVDQAKRGDNASFGLLLERYRPRLYAAALGILNDIQSANDAVQDTFVIALTKLPTLRAPAAFASWLYAILHNVCRGYLRTSLKEKNAFDTLFIENAANVKLLEESVEQALVQENVLRALASLSEPLRAAIMLRYVGSLNTYDDIAMILGIPVGTIRSRLAQARKELLGHFQLSNGDADITGVIKERQEQYAYRLGRLYQGERDWFLESYAKDLYYVSQGKLSNRAALVEEIDEDLAAGSTIHPLRFMASGSMAVAEVQIKSPPENPFRCPPMGVELLFYHGDEIVRLHRYLSHQSLAM